MKLAWTHRIIRMMFNFLVNVLRVTIYLLILLLLSSIVAKAAKPQLLPNAREMLVVTLWPRCRAVCVRLMVTVQFELWRSAVRNVGRKTARVISTALLQLRSFPLSTVVLLLLACSRITLLCHSSHVPSLSLFESRVYILFVVVLWRGAESSCVCVSHLLSVYIIVAHTRTERKTILLIILTKSFDV